MAKAAWPTGTELTNAVAGVGGSIPSSYAAADIMLQVIAEWERDTGWAPFLADAGTSTRQFNPSFGYTLRLPGFHTVTAVAIDGVAQTVDVDYWLDPQNNAARGVPITSLRLNNPLTGKPASIAVTGRLGYDDEIKEDAWFAVLNKAVAQCLELAAGPSGSVAELEQGLVKIKYGQEAGRSTIDRLKKEYRDVMLRYKRADVF